MNDDLPQFEAGVTGWTEFTLAYDLAPFLLSVPVAIQIITGSRRVLTTGLITSTEDQFAANSMDNENPLMSMLYFQGAESLRINWGDTVAALVMVAIATGEEGPDGQEGQAGGND